MLDIYDVRLFFFIHLVSPSKQTDGRTKELFLTIVAKMRSIRQDELKNKVLERYSNKYPHFILLQACASILQEFL